MTQQTVTPYKQLRRPLDDRIVAGVCSGLGRYFGIDPVLVRVAFAIVAILSWGIAAIAYPIMWFLMPEEPAPTEPRPTNWRNPADPTWGTPHPTYPPPSPTAYTPPTAFTAPTPPAQPTAPAGAAWADGDTPTTPSATSTQAAPAPTAARTEPVEADVDVATTPIAEPAAAAEAGTDRANAAPATDDPAAATHPTAPTE